MVLIRKDGRVVNLELKPFVEEEELKQLLLSNLNLIPVKDFTEDDERIVAWRSEFPLSVGSIDIAAVGDGGGIYLIETKLFKNQDKRKVMAQVLDYASDLWREYGKSPDMFLEKLEENGQGEIPDDEEFQRNIMQNLRGANYIILVAMDSVTQQVKGLIEFLNKHTDFKVLALEVERHVGEGLEVIIPRTYGEEITTEPPPPPPPPFWPLEQLKSAFAEIADQKLRERLLKMLDFAIRKNLFVQSRGKSPQFGLKAVGKVLSVTAGGLLYAFFGEIERGKYHSDESRYEFVKGLKALDLLPQDLNPDDVVSGRNLTKLLNQLTEEEFNKLLELLERHLAHNVR